MKNLTNEDMKKIVYEITSKELTVDRKKIYPVTYYEYFNELDDSVKVKVSDTIIHNVEGYNHKGNIVVFLDQISKIKGGISWKIFRLAENTYHEIRHTLQKNVNSYSYDGFLRDVDSILSVIKTDTYYSNYSSISYEIGANLYGVQKAKEYMENNFPEQYKKVAKKVEEKEEKYKYDYMLYDASNSINRLIIELQSNPEVTSKQSVKKISPVLDIFMNSNFKFKSLKDIKSDPRFKELDHRIIYAIFSSPSFYNNVVIEQLSKEELELLQSALKYTHKIYLNQCSFIEEALSKKNINKRSYYFNQRNILSKLKPIAEKENLILEHQKKNRLTR